MWRDAAIMAGRKTVPVRGSTSAVAGKMEELPDFDFASFTSEAAYGVSHISLPIDDGQVPTATFKVRRAVIKLKAVLSIQPQWKNTP